MKFALFYEIPVARPWDARERAAGLPGHARAGGGRRAVRLPRVLDRRAPLPRGVLALLEPRGALRRDRRAHREHPPRLRRAAHAEAVQPPGPHGRVGRGARPASRRPRRLRHRPLVDPGRARGLRHRPAPDPRRCGRRRSSTSSAAGPRTRYEFDGKHWQMPKRRVQPEAAPGAAPADLGRDAQRGRPPPDRRARPRPVLVRGRRAARGGEEEDRHLPRGGSRAARSRSASSSTTSAATFTMAMLRADAGGGVDARPRVVRVVPEGGRPAHRVGGRVDGRAERGPRQLRLRRGPAGRPTRAACSTCSRLEYLAESGACVLGTPTTASRCAGATRRPASTCCSAS